MNYVCLHLGCETWSYQTCISSTWTVSLRLGLTFTRLLQTVSTMIFQYTHYITIFNRVAAILHGSTRFPDKISVLRDSYCY